MAIAPPLRVIATLVVACAACGGGSPATNPDGGPSSRLPPRDGPPAPPTDGAAPSTDGAAPSTDGAAPPAGGEDPPGPAVRAFDDERVMLQGFTWESHRHGRPARFPALGERRWYEIVRDRAPAIREGRFDMIWLPPPSFAGELSAGYNPREYFRLDNSYGSLAQHREMLVALLDSGVEPIADVVINHRDGTGGWADFRNPSWGTWAICATDEAFRRPESGVAGVPDDQKGACEEHADYMNGRTYGYDAFRDLAHTDRRVRDDIIRYLLQLRALGYRGWRYDMAHGYHARWIACYDAATRPTFSVGEYDWGAHDQQRGWIWATATASAAKGLERLRSASSVFDFTTTFALRAINQGRYTALHGGGRGIGMVADATDGLPWRQRAVTFVENHDTGRRTGEDGTPQRGHERDSFANGWPVEQAYAHVLTHPGLPAVYWPHYFEWDAALQAKIAALINASFCRAGAHRRRCQAVHHDDARPADVQGDLRVGGAPGYEFTGAGIDGVQANLGPLPSVEIGRGRRSLGAGGLGDRGLTGPRAGRCRLAGAGRDRRRSCCVRRQAVGARSGSVAPGLASSTHCCSKVARCSCKTRYSAVVSGCRRV